MNCKFIVLSLPFFLVIIILLIDFQNFHLFLGQKDQSLILLKIKPRSKAKQTKRELTQAIDDHSVLGFFQ